MDSAFPIVGRRAIVEVMTRGPWELTDPAETLRQINAICPFRAGQAIVAAVQLSDQAVTGARVAIQERLSADDDLDREFDLHRELAREIAQELVPDRWSVIKDRAGMSHVLVTVVCREGRVIPTLHEHEWMRAWHYANQFQGAYDGDVYVVTPHGWTGVLDRRAGYQPCLSDRPQLRLLPPA